MKKLLNILIVEDSPEDAELVIREVKRAGFDLQWKRVENEAHFLAAIHELPDIILSDYSMPEFSGLRAMQLVNESELGIPFILISGTVGEDTAVEAMKMGVTDYLLKDRLARLGTAVRQALEEKKLRDERKRALEELRENYLFVESVLNSLAAHIVVLDEQGKIIATNQPWRRFAEENNFPGQPEDFLGQNYLAVCLNSIQKSSSADAQAALDGIQAVIQGSLREFTLEYPCHAPGEQRWFFMHVSPLDGGRRGVVVAHENITKRKLAEIELRWRTAFFEAQVHSALSGIKVVDSQRKIILQNERLGKIFHLSTDVIESKDDVILRQAMADQMKDPERYMQRVHHLYANPDEVGREDVEMADGTILERYSAPVRGRDGVYYGRIWTFRDITARRSLEEQLRQAQKMEAIGQLAGGVAHDFNNILTVIQIHASEMVAGRSGKEDIASSAQEIAEAAERAAALTRQLLIFSRKKVMQTAAVDLNDVVTNIARMLRRILGEDIALHTNCGTRLPLVSADTGMIEQVLLNLAVNSRDAMPNGGRLEIATDTGLNTGDNPDRAPDIKPGPFVALSISDNGSGIPPEVLPRIFEPFFTTKETGKGTGLGLATVYGIVKQHGGWMDVTSHVGQGTTFHICFPALEGGTKKQAPARQNLQLLGGSETILLVEDENHLRYIASNILERCGYTVLTAARGMEAIAIWEDCKDDIDLLFTDMVMPDGLTGRQLAQRLLAERPGLKVIYNSGYSAEVCGPDLVLQDGVNFLQKPYNVQKLAFTVRKMLDSDEG